MFELLFYDIAHYRRTGRTITGATAYMKLPHGPMPKGVNNVIVDMVTNMIGHDHTATSISRLSHDALWDETEIGAEISIGAASI